MLQPDIVTLLSSQRSDDGTEDHGSDDDGGDNSSSDSDGLSRTQNQIARGIVSIANSALIDTSAGQWEQLASNVVAAIGGKTST